MKAKEALAIIEAEIEGIKEMAKDRKMLGTLARAAMRKKAEAFEVARDALEAEIRMEDDRK